MVEGRLCVLFSGQLVATIAVVIPMLLRKQTQLRIRQRFPVISRGGTLLHELNENERLSYHDVVEPYIALSLATTAAGGGAAFDCLQPST
jgi:hypothetical protein